MKPYPAFIPSFSLNFSALRLLFLLVSLHIFLMLPSYLKPVQAAESCDAISCDKELQDDAAYLRCTEDKIACWQGKVSEARTKSTTLQSTIDVLNGQINIQQWQVNQTQAEINSLEKQIIDLNDRLAGLDVSLDRLSEALVERVQEHYKRQTATPLGLLLISDSLNNFLAQRRYLQLAQEHLSENMQQAETQRLDYDVQKQLKEEKQAEIESKKAVLVQQQQQLTLQRGAEQKLLTQTKNDETRFQQLLSEAQAELASLKNFSTSKGGGVLPPQNSPDGWYFSQRDERWANNRIGGSSESILDVGCLISSAAMIKKKLGEDVTPAGIAANSSYFFSTTAYMLQPYPTPSGYSYINASYSQSRLDAELEKNPVIIKLSAGPYGTHFIVMKEKKDGKYIMHDPWEGYDKTFTDFYSFGQIIRMTFLQKN